MKWRIWASTTAALLLACSASVAAAATTSPAVKQLRQLFDQEWQRMLREQPELASYYGDRRYNDRWTDLSLDAFTYRHAANRAALWRLKQIPRSGLPPAEQLNYDLFKKQLAQTVEAYRYRQFLMPMDQLNGIQTADEILELLSFDTLKDYEDWLQRLNRFDAMMDQTLVLMRVGLAEKRTHPRIVMQRLSAQISQQIVDQAEDSPFFAPFRNFPPQISAADQERLKAAAQRAILDGVVPAYRRLQQFYDNEYLPACRDGIAAIDHPDGTNYYGHLVRLHTTTDLTPEQIHQIGLDEVARIRAAMDQVIAQTGFKGSFKEFLDFMRTDRRFFFKTGDELLNAYASLAKRIDPEVVKLFGKIPRLPYGVRAVPEANAPNQTTAYYYPGTADGRRAGYFYANTYQPESRPQWEMEALTLHEAVPGHHFQIALAQELGDLPMFRRQPQYSAFVEGWGLYAESLGSELGLYQNPYSKFGQLSYEMWRAIRLVVDTGMHAKGWTREQALDLFRANTGKSELDIANEVDRYITWPGQALAYKIGELKIKQLRARAQEKLGPKFDLRAFHDLVLGSGALPLDILEAKVDDWVRARR